MTHPNDETKECPNCGMNMIRRPSIHVMLNVEGEPSTYLPWFYWCGNCNAEFDQKAGVMVSGELSEEHKIMEIWKRKNQPTDLERASATIQELQYRINGFQKWIDELREDKNSLETEVRKLQSKLDRQHENWTLRGDPYDYGSEE